VAKSDAPAPAAKPVAEAVNDGPRRPKVGDSVLYRTWGAVPDPEAPSANAWHAVVAKTMGLRVNLAVLSGTGMWLAEGPVDFDPTGLLPGHWSWDPDHR